VKPDQEKRIVERICETLKNERVRRGVSQQRLAEIAGLSRTGLRHIESLQINPTLYSLLRLAKALELDLAAILSSEVSD
jgi:transcriptional regulator with XRE-family HTH domain